MKQLKEKISHLFEESDTSLAPILTLSHAAYIFNALWVSSGLLLAFWPKKRLFYYFIDMDRPLNFLVVSVTILLASSLLGLVDGIGFMIKEGFGFRSIKIEVVTPEEQHPFLTFGFIKFCIHSVIYLFPFIPLLLISASLSVVPVSAFFQSLLVIFLSTLFFRLVGFKIYLRYGKWRQVGQLWGALTILGYFAGTALAGKALNPILLLYALMTQDFLMGLNGVHAMGIYSVITTLLILFLAITIHLKPRRKPSTKAFI